MWTLKYIIFPLAVWSFIVGFSYNWNLNQAEKNTETLALDRAQAFFNIVQTHRLWNANHGGVYVPITEKVQPNPYLLDDPMRDIQTDTGLALTKINPAYMTRLVGKIAKEKDDVLFHLTSLKPLRPANRADSWETEALVSFENGSAERLSLENIEGVKVYRYMAPLFVKPPCMKCHAKQGYKVGDVRGGIGISIPASTMRAVLNWQETSVMGMHIITFIFGVIFILAFQYRARQEYLNTSRSLKEKESLLKEIHHRVKNNLQIITSLLSIQSRRTSNKEAQDLFDICANRVRSMGLIHEKLYQSKDLGHINARTYFTDLIKGISETIKSPGNIVYKTEIDELNLTMDTAIPCGLIINELTTNSIKHAFDGSGGTITIRLKMIDKTRAILSVEDNGRGMVNHSFKTSESLGMTLVESLANQLEGTVRTHSNKGWHTEIVFNPDSSV
jgi:two-component sensor histidine kinase